MLQPDLAARAFPFLFMSHPLETLLRKARRLLGVSEMHGSQSLPARLYTCALELATLGRGIPRHLNGEPVLRLDPRCRFLDDSYEPEVWSWLKQRLNPGDVMLDVGAQFGLYAMLAARVTGPGGKVHAFEPAPDSQAVMRRHLKLNGLADAVTLVPAAASTDSGEAVLHMAGTHPSNTLAPTGADPVALKPVKVRVVSLDDYCREQNITPKLVKIDVEGWELNVLKGATGLLANPATIFLVEMHPYAWQSAGHDAQAVADFLSAHHLELEPLTGQSDPLREYGEVWIKTARQSA